MKYLQKSIKFLIFLLLISVLTLGFVACDRNGVTGNDPPPVVDPPVIDPPVVDPPVVDPPVVDPPVVDPPVVDPPVVDPPVVDPPVVDPPVVDPPVVDPPVVDPPDDLLTVTFDSMDGSTVPSYTVNKNDKLPQPPDPVRTGYAFEGWYVSKTDISLDTRWNFIGFTVTETFTLYANWIPSVYTVEFAPNGGTGIMPPMICVYDVENSLSSVGYIKTGYVFNGWNTETDGAGRSFSDGEAVKNLSETNEATVILYAQWTAESYPVKLDKNGGGVAENIEVTYDAEMPEDLPIPQRPGYSFLGYYDALNYGTKYYDADMVSVRVWDKTNGATLYARWQGKQYNVTFDKNDGSGGTNSVKATFGSTMPTAQRPSRRGYTFQGYFDSQGKKYYDANIMSTQVWDKKEDAILFARWSVNTYTILLNQNGGTGGSTSATVTYGESMPDNLQAPQKKGYTFLGYYDSLISNGYERQYYGPAMESLRQWNQTVRDPELFARWQAKSYTVILDDNYDGGQTSTVKATFDAELPVKQIPARPGCAFLGYYDADGTLFYDQEMNGTQTWNADVDYFTLYARWRGDSLRDIAMPFWRLSGHGFVIDSADSLWAIGSNDYGQLGDGTREDRDTFVFVRSNIKAVSSGFIHSIAIDSDGNLWTWGSNDGGQIGDGTTSDRLSPLQVMKGTKFKAIAAGSRHNLAIDTDGNLWAWGDNDDGQIGDGTTTDRFLPVQIMKGTKFTTIAAGDRHSLALDTDGNLWTWGDNSYGQIGDGTTTECLSPAPILTGTKITAINAAANQSFAIDTEGGLRAWGDNSYGQLGNESKINTCVPVSVKQDTKFVAVAAGKTHTMAIDTVGNLWAWGDNHDGQLGDGTTTERLSPIHVRQDNKFKSVWTGLAISFAMDANENIVFINGKKIW